jgi:coproporphyrinogen III oxidase
VRFERIIRNAQDSICAAVEEVDGNKFHEDAWSREDGGGGISRVLQGGNVWEKAGVNVSVVYGSMPASAYRAATERNIEAPPDASRVPFFAAGISSVMHPYNPHAPTMHFNYRCGSFLLSGPSNGSFVLVPSLLRWRPLQCRLRSFYCIIFFPVSHFPCHMDIQGWPQGVPSVLQGGNVWEQPGVNVSVVYGSMMAAKQKQSKAKQKQQEQNGTRDTSGGASMLRSVAAQYADAACISSVMHPYNPPGPTMRFHYECEVPFCQAQRRLAELS